MKNQATASPAKPKPTPRSKPLPTLKKGNGPLASASVSNGQDHDEIIRQTAYFLYESRRCEGGHDIDDWLEAEALVASQSQTSSLRTAH